MKKLLFLAALAVALHAQTLEPSPSSAGTGGSSGSGLGDGANSIAFSATSGTPTCTVTSNTVSGCTVTITGNITSCTLAGLTTGQDLTLTITQDGSGSHTFACSSFTGLGTISPTASQSCSQPFRATSSSAATAKGPMLCPTSDALTLNPGSGGTNATFPAGTGSLCFSGACNPDAVPTSAGTSITVSLNAGVAVCTSTCTITVPVPSAGVQYCVLNGNNVSTVITLSALGSSAMYQKTDRTAYGTAGTGTMVSGGAVGDQVCIYGLDSTHYLTLAYGGTWTVN